MYKLVVIDDEYIVLEGIKALISKMDLPFEVVGFAYDGVMALDVIKKINPDLVITDIRIPAIDGLALIEQAKDFCPETIFVVISGYMEFEYARKALLLGVKDFVDKPLSAEKLRNLLVRMEKLIENSKTESFDERVKHRNYFRLEETLKNGMTSIVNCDNENFHIASIKVWNTLDAMYKDLKDLSREIFKVISVFSDILNEQNKTFNLEENFSYSEIEKLEDVESLKKYYKKAITRIGQCIEADNTGASHRVILQVLDYIKENYNKDIGLTELAELANMNAAYLSSLFKDEVGMTYVKYVTELRIAQAKKLLLEGYKVNEVSYMVGYNNYRHFGNLFKKYVGVTPNEYKKVKGEM